MLPLVLSLIALGAPQTAGSDPAGAELATDELSRVRAEAQSALERATAAQESGDTATARAGAARAIELLGPLPLGEGHDETAVILWNAGIVAYQAGDLGVAREAWGRVLDHRERTLPADHPDVLTARSNLIATMLQMGDLAGARTLEEAVVEERERTLPADHPDLLAARLKLLATVHRMGDLPGTRALEEAVLGTRERTLPADHPDLLVARQNLAITMRDMGDLADARALFEVVIEARERTLPPDHPDLLAARQSLAGTMYEMGDLAGARALLEAVLESRERTLPPDHPELLRTRQNLGGTMYEMGDPVGARALFEAVLGTRERTLPADHPDLSIARSNLAETMDAMGDFAGARALQEAVLEASERTLPADHPDLLLARQSLATTMYEMGDLADARALQEAVIEARERTLHADHPDLLTTRQGLATTMRMMGDIASARALFEAVLEARERTLHADHSDLLLARQGLAATMFDMGDLADARALQEAVIEARERTLHADHHHLLTARQGLASIMSQMGDLAGARALQEAVLEAQERTLHADHPLLLITRESLASTMGQLGDLAGARVLFEAVLEAYERTLPADHPNLLSARASLAITMKDMGDFAGARALLEAVLEPLERTLPADHPDLLLARFNLASTMRRMGDLAGARALQEAMLEARERTLPADHPDLSLAGEALAITMSDMGDLAGARALGVDLARGMLLRLEHASVLSPREAREAVGAEAVGHSMLRFLTESGGAEDREDAAPTRFELAETLRAVASTPGGGAGDDDPRRREISALRARLNDLVSGGPREGQPSKEFAAEVSRLTLERDRLERAIRSDLAKEGVVTGAVRAADVAKALPEGTVAVGFLRHEKVDLDPVSSTMMLTHDVLAAHVLVGSGSLTEVELGPADELEELASTWRASLGQPLGPVSRGSYGARVDRGIVLERDELEGEPGRERAAGDALRARLLDPILDSLGEGVETLHVCLDDFLHLLPLDALPLGPDEGGERVRDRYRVVSEVSFARLLSNRPPTEGEPTLLAMGDVAFESSADVGTQREGAESFTPLPQTRIEAESVGRLFREELGEAVSLLAKAEATKDGFREKAPGARFLHVATHGWFAPETVPSTLDAQGDDALWSPTGAQEAVTGLAPMTLCGLAFAGANQGRDSLGRVPGIMTAEELAGIDLSACELAVLSACETNVGIRRAGQGIQSLQSALHAAGVRTAITSLWKVDDAMTRRLMELFYTYLWVEKMPKADALWRAKSDLRDEGAAVRDWAGWVLSGDPQ